MNKQFLLIHEDGEVEVVKELPSDVDASQEAGILDVVRFSKHSGFQFRSAGGFWSERP